MYYVHYSIAQNNCAKEKKHSTVMVLVTGQIFSLVHHLQLELDFKTTEILPALW